MYLFQKQKIFSDFFLNFLNLDSILSIFKKKTTLIPYVFLNLRTQKHEAR